MLKKIFIPLFFVTLFSSTTALASAELKAIAKDQVSLTASQKKQIIFETSGDYIMKASSANFEQNNYYFVQLSHAHGTAAMSQWMSKNTDVVLLKNEEYAVVKTNDDDILMTLANKAHKAGHYCGRIQKLSPQGLEFDKKEPPQRVASKKPEVSEAVSKVVGANIIKTIKTMQAWKTRYESHPDGQMTGEKLKDIYQALVPGDREDVSIDLVEHRGSPQKSIRVSIEGKTRPDEVVILGSHIDSINSSNNNDAPGADDNASGTSTNIEVFRTLMEVGFRPESTIEIHGYGAEEIGLVGSQEMADDYKSRGVNVVSMVQFDMNGFAKNEAKISFVTNKTNSRLNGQLQDLVEIYLEVGHSSGFLLFGSSDHASWDRRGFPVAFPTEDPFGFNRKIHTKDDTFNNINSEKQIYEFGKLGVAYLMHFAG